MPARRKINQNLKPQESKANEFIQRFKFDKFMDYDKEAEDMALLIIEVILRQGFVAIPVQPKQDDDDEIPFASQITRTKIGMAEKHKGYKDTAAIFDSIKQTIDADGNNF